MIALGLLLIASMFDSSHSKLEVNDVVLKAFADWRNNYGFLPQSSIPNRPNGESAYSEQIMSFKKTLMQVKLQEIRYYSGRSDFYMRLNAFSASNPGQKALLNGFIEPGTAERSEVEARSPSPINFPPAPASLDYRDLGLVTDVADQGFYCASCYAFSAVCALEGQIAKIFNSLVQLSPQNLVDCSSSYGNSGCDGGFMGASYEYVKQNPGIASELTYPYSGFLDTCQYDSSMLAANVLDYYFVSGDEEYLKRALAAVGLLAVGMKGDLDSFYGYGGGIYDDVNCNANANHAVCLIGYGTDNTTSPPTDFWILKNSWSTEWGEGGYFRMQRGKNRCGITSYVVYPIVA